MNLEADKRIEDEQRAHHRRKLDNLYVEGFTGNDWGDKMTFTIGVTYFGGSLLVLLEY